MVKDWFINCLLRLILLCQQIELLKYGLRDKTRESLHHWQFKQYIFTKGCREEKSISKSKIKWCLNPIRFSFISLWLFVTWRRTKANKFSYAHWNLLNLWMRWFHWLIPGDFNVCHSVTSDVKYITFDRFYSLWIVLSQGEWSQITRNSFNCHVCYLPVSLATRG